MKYSWSSVVVVATLVGLAYAYPHNARSRADVSPWNPQAPYFAQHYGRLGRVGPLDEDESELERGRKYKITNKKSKKKSKTPVVVEDEPEDEEEQDEVDEESDEEPNDDQGHGPSQGDYPNEGPQELHQYAEEEPSQDGGYGPPPSGGDYRYEPASQGPPRGYYRRLPTEDYYQPTGYRGRYRSPVPMEDEDYDLAEMSGPPRRRSSPRYRSEAVAPRRVRGGRSGTRIITGWSDTPLRDNYNPEMIANPTLMLLRRRRRYHPSQRIPLQKIPIRSGYYGNPRDTYINPYGGQHWSTGPFQPYIYSHN